MQKAIVSRFFKQLFENKQRRLALLGRFLCVFRSEFNDPVDLTTFYLHTFACDPTAFALERLGMRLTCQGFFIPYAWLTVDEQHIIKYILDNHSEFFNEIEWNEHDHELRVAKSFKFDEECVMTPLHRRLLLRDYCTMCILQLQLNVNPRIPTYALMGCKRLLEKHPGNANLCLVHWMLDSLKGNAHELPVI